ncbi:Chromate resistance protein ChrB [Streptomyces sp. NPDC049040]|uniref:Chromate resistance protein ChrB n=1 Tax=Streptomyces sp. NPDC049040 TaxID=3365593 RepID=UPI00371C3E7D
MRSGRRQDAADSPVREDGGAQWLVLVYKIPAEPTRLRAGVWRKIKNLGAVYLQNAVAALPYSPASERALRLLRNEITEMGGTAFLMRSDVLSGHAEAVDAFNAARDAEYEEIVDKCQDFLKEIEKEEHAEHFTFAELEENDEDLTKLRTWLGKVEARDVLGASGRAAAKEAVQGCEQILEGYAARVYAEEEGAH